MSPQIPTAPGRLRSLDWLRGVAVLVMVECHVFNALLAAEYRSTAWFRALDVLNGFVAPAFLLVSGAVLGLNLHHRGDRGTGKLWRRVGQIFLIAYLLHLPTVLLWQFFGEQGPHLVELWTRMDILQCVAASLALVLLLVPLCRTPRVHRQVCLALGVLVTLLPVDVSPAALPAWLRNYLGPTGVGLFPLLPWAGFPLLGVWWGPAIFNHPERRHQTLRAALAGLTLLVTAQALPAGPVYGATFVWEKIGGVLLALGACVWLDAPVRGTAWILRFGELSLWSYAVHLVIVYGSCLNPGLAALHPRFAWWSALPALGLVLFVTARVVHWRAQQIPPRVPRAVTA